MSALNATISFYTHLSHTARPVNGPFLQVVTSEKLAAKYGGLIEQIRRTADKETRTALKKQLPCFTPSGTFGHRAADGLARHSGLLQFDIDPTENPFLNATTAPELKRQIANLKEVAYCALSASGTGVWGVVSIAYPEQHKSHFRALERDFEKWGIVLDAACSNIDRLRFWSYDPDAHINHNAVVYTALDFGEKERYTPAPRLRMEGGNVAKVETIMGQIEAARADITAGGNGYEDWFSIGCALAHEFGENGRDYFHKCSQFHPNYRQNETDKQYTSCLKNPGTGISISTFFSIAKRYGFEYKGRLPRLTAPPIATSLTNDPPPPPNPPQPILSPNGHLPTGYRRERFTDRITGQFFEVLLNAEGYPATWDLPPIQKTTLSRCTKTAPAITDLICRLDLRFDGVEAITAESEAAFVKARERADAIRCRATPYLSFKQKKMQKEPENDTKNRKKPHKKSTFFIA